MQNLKSYAKCREDLLWDALNLAGTIATHLPATLTERSPIARAGGSPWNNPTLKVVLDRLHDVTYRFDQLQHALGLAHPDDARFGHPPAGSHNDPPPPEETPAVAKKAAKKPKGKKSPPPSKQKPTTKGGAGYNDNYHGR